VDDNDDRNGGARSTHTGAARRDIADAGGGTAHGGALGVRGTGGDRSVTILFEVADTRRGPTRRAGGDEHVGRAVVADAVAAVVDVADSGRGPAHGGALGVGGAVD